MSLESLCYDYFARYILLYRLKAAIESALSAMFTC